MAGVSAAATAGTAAVAGTIVTLVIENTSAAEVAENVVITSGDEENGDGDVEVAASDDSLVFGFAGSLSAAGTVGVGATVSVLVFSKTVEAVNKAKTTWASNTVNVHADDISKLILLAIGFGAAGTAGIAGDVNAMVYNDTVTAGLGGTVTGRRMINVSATADNMLVNVAAGVAAGGTAGVSAVALVTYFEGTTAALIYDNAKLYTTLEPEEDTSEPAGDEANDPEADPSDTDTAEKPVDTTGNITVYAESQEIVTGDGAGAALGGTAGVGGTVDVIVTKLHTSAKTGTGVTVVATGDFSVDAKDTYGLVAIVATVALGGTAGVGVTALVSVSLGDVAAAIGGTNDISAKNVRVHASDNRDLVTADGTVAVGGVAGVGATVTVIIAGAKMSQDAHDTLYGTKDINGKSYEVYEYWPNGIPEDNSSDDSISLYKNNGVFYWFEYNEETEQYDFVPYTDTINEEYLSKDGMDPLEQMKYAFDKGAPAAKASKPNEGEMNAALQGDGQKPGDADYSSYGQGGKTYETEKGETLYIYVETKDGNGDAEDGEYVVYDEKTATQEQKDQPKYRYDAETDSYIALTQSYSSATFDSTADGEAGRSTFTASPITITEKDKDGKK